MGGVAALAAGALLAAPPPTFVLLLSFVRRRLPLASVSQQAGVDFLHAQVPESGIDQCFGRQRKTISDQDRIDCQVRSFVPESWIAIAAATLMAQGTVYDFVGKRCPIRAHVRPMVPRPVRRIREMTLVRMRRSGVIDEASTRTCGRIGIVVFLSMAS